MALMLRQIRAASARGAADSRVGVAEGPAGTVTGCVAVAERTVWLNGRTARTMYVGDLEVHPDRRGGPVADALTRWAADECRAAGGPDVPMLLTILAGNAAMERRSCREMPKAFREAGSTIY